MYVPEAFQVNDREAVLDLIESSPFATVVTATPELTVSHVPVELERPASGAGAGWGRLLGHVARGNPHGRLFDGAREALFVFHGPHAYVSPRSYADPAAPPTWNYAVAHVTGRPVAVEDAERKRALIDVLVARYESGPLALGEAARAGLLRGIVAFEVEIERVEAKFKLGQNRSPADRAGTVAALEVGGDTERALAAWTRRLTELA